VHSEGEAPSTPSDGLAAPLSVDGQVVAVLLVQERPHHLGPFSDADLRLFESLANHASVSLHKARLVDRLREEVAAQEHQALHDALTGLPNRRHALRTLEAELAASPRTGVLVVDLDGFTDINEALGQGTGDELLREAGRRLSVFASKPGQVARLGNDEFAVVLRDVEDDQDGQRQVEVVLSVFAAPFVVKGLTVVVGANAGLALGSGGGDAARLLQGADAAMYAAKRERVPMRTWDFGAQVGSVRRLALIGHLRDAITAGDLEVYYQPKVAPGTGEPVGAEAVVRWDHPEHGQVSPDEFIPLAEHSGLIHPLTTVVLDAALAECARWRAAGTPIGVAVNLSTRSLVDPVLPAQIQDALARAEMPASALTLEITETAVMADLTRSLAVLHELRALGVRLSVDDFGTGRASLSYLKHLPVDEMKVDRSFVQGVATSRADAAIVQAAIDLGHALGLRVVAEGVEDERSRNLLAAWGCDVLQGFLVSRPLPAAAFAEWLGSARDVEAVASVAARPEVPRQATRSG
jgi:diguanylate cyclase (GGDEF)-like protein